MHESRGCARFKHCAMTTQLRPWSQWRRRQTPVKRRALKVPMRERMRKGSVKRATKETDVEVAVDLDGSGASSIATGIGFLDHMLDLLARHSRIDLTVKAKGDLHIDHHHTTEDVGIALGQAVKQALGDMKGITRYADVHVPMDEALTRVAIDISGRPFLVFKAQFVRDKVGTFDTELVQEWFQAFAMNSGVTLHLETLYGSNDHHIAESCFKGLARALRAAVAIDRARGRRNPLDQGHARRMSVSRGGAREESKSHGDLHRARAAAEGRRGRARSGAFRLRARRLFVLGVPAHARSGCCGTGCGWCCSAIIVVAARAAGRALPDRRLDVGDVHASASCCRCWWASRRRRCAASRWRRRGWTNVGIVVGDDVESAERRFFDAWVRGEHGRGAAAAPATAAVAPADAGLRRHRPVPRAGSAAVTVAIVDYGSGNLHSAAKAFERAAREQALEQPIVVTRDPDRSPAPTGWCCRASAHSRIAGAASTRSAAWSMRSTPACASAAGRSSASASACSSWPSAAANTRWSRAWAGFPARSTASRRPIRS